MKEERYYFIKQVDGIKFYAPYLNIQHKYIAEFEENNKIISIHFHFDYDSYELFYIDSIYKNMRRYKSYKFIKPYAENEKLIKKIRNIEKTY